jgi:AcrR family transcriptional regulator
VSARPRQTQAQRRAVALAKISVAGQEILAEAGYHAMTFANVAERAGVSRGSLMHYFSQKSDLAIAVIEDGMVTLLRELRSKVPTWQAMPPGAGRDEQIFDDIYFGGPLFQAWLAVAIHARTDNQLDKIFRRMSAENISGVCRIAAEGWGPELMRSPQWEDFLIVVQSVIQGVAMMHLDQGWGTPDGAAWPAARRLLLIALEDLRAGRRLDGGQG